MKMTTPVTNASATVRLMSATVPSQPSGPPTAIANNTVVMSESVVAPMKSLEPVVNMRALPDHFVT